MYEHRICTTSKEFLAAAGFFFDTSHGMKQFGDQYMAFSSIEEVRYGDNPIFVSEPWPWWANGRPARRKRRVTTARA